MISVMYFDGDGMDESWVRYKFVLNKGEHIFLCHAVTESIEGMDFTSYATVIYQGKGGKIFRLDYQFDEDGEKTKLREFKTSKEVCRDIELLYDNEYITIHQYEALVSENEGIWT
jgi:hypothetical protein